MKIRIKALIIFILSSNAVLPVFAQSENQNTEVVHSPDGKGWVFGLNVGVYHPSKKTAEYYSGASKNENNLDYVLSNYYWHQEIFLALKANDTILVASLPENIKYNIAMQPGIYAQYCFSPTLALIIEFNYMKLKVNDAVTFEVDPKPYATQPDYRLIPLRGVEERVYADIALKRTLIKNEKQSYFAIGGINVSSTQVKKSSIFVEEKEYSMVNIYGNGTYVPNGNTQSYNVYQGGIGIGMIAGIGTSLNFSGIVLEPGITAHWLMVKLKGYQSMNPGFGAYIRFLY